MDGHEEMHITEWVMVGMESMINREQMKLKRSLEHQQKKFQKSPLGNLSWRSGTLLIKITPGPDPYFFTKSDREQLLTTCFCSCYCFDRKFSFRGFFLVVYLTFA